MFRHLLFFDVCLGSVCCFRFHVFLLFLCFVVFFFLLLFGFCLFPGCFWGWGFVGVFVFVLGWFFFCPAESEHLGSHVEPEGKFKRILEAGSKKPLFGD